MASFCHGRPPPGRCATVDDEPLLGVGVHFPTERRGVRAGEKAGQACILPGKRISAQGQFFHLTLQSGERGSPVLVLRAERILLTIGASFSQVELGDGQRYEAIFIGLETIPSDEQVEGGDGERQPRQDVIDYPMHDFLEVTDQG